MSRATSAPADTPVRGHWSISEVLSLLEEEFPDVTISKIRFLESKGLIQPARTPSGYRKFSAPDLERLRWILRMQRDHFLPLRVIRQRLEESGAIGSLDDPNPGPLVAEEANAAPSADAPTAAPLPVTPTSTRRRAVATDSGRASVVGSIQEEPPRTGPDRTSLSDQTGLSISQLQELSRYGILEERKVGAETVYDTDSVALAQLAAEFLRTGVEPRHLRTMRNAADREADLLRQLVSPMLRAKNPQARQQANDTIELLVGAGERLRGLLMRRALRDLLGG